jgi:hypothetical protein
MAKRKAKKRVRRGVWLRRRTQAQADTIGNLRIKIAQLEAQLAELKGA